MEASITSPPTCLHSSPSYSPFNECHRVVELQGQLCHPGPPSLVQLYLSGFCVLWCPGAPAPPPSCRAQAVMVNESWLSYGAQRI